MRRKNSPHGVLLLGNMISQLSKEEFLHQFGNKANFVTLVSKNLDLTGCRVLYATVDADREIPVTDVNELLWKVAMIIGEDTYLLILTLCYNRNPRSLKLIYRVDKEVTKNSKI